MGTSQADFGQQSEEGQQDVVVGRRSPCCVHQGLQKGFAAPLADHVANPPVCAYGERKQGRAEPSKITLISLEIEAEQGLIRFTPNTKTV